MRRLAFLCCLWLLASPGRADGEETTLAEGDHFAVVLHFETEDLANAALAQLEQLWKPAAALYGLPKGPLDKKLVVHLYRDANAYQVAEEGLTGGRFKKNLAFAHFDSQTAHVALQPDLSDDALTTLGLPYLTRSMILHEAAHLVRYRAMPNFRSHPDWLSDGAAMWLKYGVLAGDDVDRVPLSSTPVVNVRTLLDKGELPDASAILADDVEALGFYDRYSTRYVFFRFLQTEHAKETVDVVRAMRRFGGGGAFATKVADALEKRLGSERFATLNDDFRAFVRSLKPAWQEIHRSLGPGDEERVQIAFPATNAIAWRTESVGKTTYEVSATVRILPNSTHQLNLLLDRRGNDFLCIAFSAGFGVTLFEYSSEDSRWNRIQAVRNADVVVGEPFRVSAKVEGKDLRVTVNDTEVLSASFPDRTMSGPYGLGALAGSAGVWMKTTLR